MQPSTDKSYYDLNYQNYGAQNPANKLNFYLSLLKKYIPSGGKVFELGLAMGLFMKVAESQYEYFGSDINEYGVKSAKEKSKNAKLFVGSTETLEQAHTELDAVVAWDVLEHLPDIKSGLQDIKKNLKDSGHIIAVVPIYDGGLGWLVSRLDKDPTHITKVGRHDWIRLLDEAGFEVIEWGGILRKLVFNKYLHITQPQPFLRFFCSGMYFVAKKPNTSH